jgi:hypothetical protein
MTYTLCAKFCAGYAYLGLEYSSECYCASTLPSNTTLYPDTECNMPCSGSPSQLCGAANRLTLFKSDIISTPPTNPPILNYTYSGCYTDDVNARILSDSFLLDGEMSVEKCAGFCNGSRWFGTEYGGECYCGEVLEPEGSVDKVVEGECGFVCGGDEGEFCGGDGKIGVYGRNG